MAPRRLSGPLSSVYGTLAPMRRSCRVRAYGPIDGRRVAACDSAARGTAASARSRRLSRRVASMAPSNARLLARPATRRRLVWALPLVWSMELVGRRLVLGRGAAGGRRLLPSAEPRSDQLDLGRRAVALPADPARNLSLDSPRSRLDALDRDDVSLVVQPPGRVPHQPDGLVPAASGASLPRLDRLAQLHRSLARELREGSTDGIDDVRVGAAELGRPQPEVQASRELIEEIEAGGRVLDLDAIEGQLGRQPADAVHRVPAAHLPLSPPERVRRDGDAALFMNRMDGGGGRQSRLHAVLEEEADDVPVAARDLFAHDHVELGAPGRIIGRAARAFDRVVVGDRDHVEAGSPGGVLDELGGRRPAVAYGRVHVEVR